MGNPLKKWFCTQERDLGMRHGQTRRHEHRKCGSCMFFQPITRDGDEAPNGRCRRRAPISGLGYPSVDPISDWCGEHKLDEWNSR
jgi:hypothetical protein